MHFEPLIDASALACVRHLEDNGATGVLVVGAEGCRIVRSLNLCPDNQYLWHVSVSRDGRAVSWELAERFARELAPAVEQWERFEKSGKATHVWELKP